MPNDDDIWNRYASGVKKIRKTKASPTTTSSPRKRESSASDSEHKSLRRADAHRIPAFAGITPKETAIQHPLDRRVERDIRQGQIALEARIDLHGMTQAVAYEALTHFVATHAKAGHRNLLIITGKGKGNAGVLKTNLPLWLQTLPEAAQIMALRPAAPKHGGDGAFYLLLRKKGAKVKH